MSPPGLRAVALVAVAGLAACGEVAPVQVAPCGGRNLAVTDDAIYVACPLLARLDLDGTVRWGSGDVVAGPLVPPGDDLYWGGVADGRFGIVAQAKATGVTRQLAPVADDTTHILSLAVVGADVFWLEASPPPTTWSLRRVPRAGGAATTVLVSTDPLDSLAGSADALFWLTGQANVERGLDVTRLELATGATTTLAHVDGATTGLPSLAVGDGVIVPVYALDSTVDAYRVRPGAATATLVAEDIRGTLAAAGDRLMAGTVRVEGDDLTRILPSQPHSFARVGLAGDDVYFADGFALWRRPYAGDPSPQVPSFEIGPPLVGVPP